MLLSFKATTIKLNSIIQHKLRGWSHSSRWSSYIPCCSLNPNISQIGLSCFQNLQCNGMGFTIFDVKFESVNCRCRAAAPSWFSPTRLTSPPWPFREMAHRLTLARLPQTCWHPSPYPFGICTRFFPVLCRKLLYNNNLRKRPDFSENTLSRAGHKKSPA